MNSYQIDRDKWQRLDIFQQMGNIYAEVGRTLAAKNRGDSETAKAAAIRAFDLFDATADGLVRLRSPKLSELLRSRELFADAYLTGTDQKLDDYFSQFAVAARLRQFA